jgi:hypothetical protein
VGGGDLLKRVHRTLGNRFKLCENSCFFELITFHQKHEKNQSFINDSIGEEWKIAQVGWPCMLSHGFCGKKNSSPNACFVQGKKITPFCFQCLQIKRLW